MKTQIQNLVVALVLLALPTLNLQLSTAHAQGTAFTYQGRLNDGANPANGHYDFQFIMFSQSQFGNPVGPILTNSNVAVNNGLFTVTLDFGGGIFTGTNYWLDISVRTNGGGAFTELSPRQTLTPTPYAISAGNLPSLSVQQNTYGAPDMIGGSPRNYVSDGVVGATIAGGGAINYFGYSYTNKVSGNWGTVSGGGNNTANGQFATVVGGENNTASGYAATVGGGFGNTASGDFSFAAGSFANAKNKGSFVWADPAGITFSSAADDQFRVRALGGVAFVTGIDGSGNAIAGVHLLHNDTAWSSISDKNAKKNFQPINGEAVLEQLAAIPVEKWNYKWEADTNTPHIGPMAQDFKGAFYPGRDDKSISTLEFDGVELAAIQGLNQKLEQKEAEITELKRRLEALEKIILSRKSN
jgi:hypothetical protein